MIFLLQLLLATSTALGQATFGPEIELRGARHNINTGCLGGFIAGVGVQGANAVGALAQENPDPEAHGITALATAGGQVLCIRVSRYSDFSGKHYLKKIEDDLKRTQPDVKREWIKDGHLKTSAIRATYPDGRVIVFSQDPGVIEVKIPKITAEQARVENNFLQKEIWDRSERVGLKAPKSDGPWNGGHVHMGIEEALDNDPKKLKNMVFDHLLHPELADGVLGRDAIGPGRGFALNAKIVDVNKKRNQLEAFGKEMDEMAARGEKLTPEKIQSIEKRYNSIFGKSSELHINGKFGTVERRGPRSPKNADEFAKVVELYDARVKYTNSLEDVELPKNFEAPKTPEEKAAAFKKYVEQSGRNYRDFKDLAPASLQVGGAAAKPSLSPKASCLFEALEAI